MSCEFYFNVAAGNVPNHASFNMNLSRKTVQEMRQESEFVVPATQFAMCVGFYGSTGKNSEFEIRLEIADTAGNYSPARHAHIIDGSIEVALSLPIKMVPGQKIRLGARQVTGNNFSGGYDLILVDDAKTGVTSRL